jgi:hypothetical protein
MYTPLAHFLTTLALDSRPRQGLARVQAKKKTRECGRVWEWTLTLPSWTSMLGVEVPMDSRNFIEWFQKENPSPWRVLYIIGKLLKRKCPKWVRMTHLDICNTSYGQKKGQESNWQFDSQPQKVRNWPDSLMCKWLATCRWKALDEGYNFGLNLIQIGGLHKKLWTRKVVRVPTSAISGLPLGSYGTKSHWDATPTGRCRVYYMGEGGRFPQVWVVVSLVSLRSLVVRPSTKGAPTLC